MNKNLYIFLILFMGIDAALNLENGLLGLLLGGAVFTLDSYIAWFVAANITGIIGSLLLFKYYYNRNYRFVFFLRIMAAIAQFVSFFIIYRILTSGALRSYYAPALLIYLGISIVYAAGLIFSRAGERFWLKLAGICSFVITVVLAAILVINMYAPITQSNVLLQKIALWASTAFTIVPILFILNFLNEIKILSPKSHDTRAQKPLATVFGFLAILGLVAAVTLGILLASESHSQLYWKKYNAEQSLTLVKLAGGAKTFVNSKGDSLHYILIKPQGYDQQKKYPLVVSLPYGGYEASAAELLTTDVYRRAYPAFIFVPYCPEGSGWGGIPGSTSLDLLVYETINALAEPGIDVKRRYVTGVSRGGYGTWQFICTRPDMFAAAIPVSGGGDPALASKITRVPVWAFHGAKDRNVPVAASRNMIAAIRGAGGKPKYTEFPNEGHNIWDQVTKTPGLLEWLFAQRQE